MNCHKLDSVLIEYLDGRLPARERAGVERHLASCPECAGYARDFRSVFSSLEAWKAPEVSPWFYARLRQRIAVAEAEAAERRTWRGLVRLVRRPVYGWAMAGVVLAASFVVWNARQAAPVRNAPATRAVAAERPRMDEIIPVVDDYEIVADFDLLGELKHDKNKL